MENRDILVFIPKNPETKKNHKLYMARVRILVENCVQLYSDFVYSIT